MKVQAKQEKTETSIQSVPKCGRTHKWGCGGPPGLCEKYE